MKCFTTKVEISKKVNLKLLIITKLKNKNCYKKQAKICRQKKRSKRTNKIKLQTKFDLIDYNVNRNLLKNVFVENKKRIKKTIFAETKID